MLANSKCLTGCYILCTLRCQKGQYQLFSASDFSSKAFNFSLSAGNCSSVVVQHILSLLKTYLFVYSSSAAKQITPQKSVKFMFSSKNFLNHKHRKAVYSDFHEITSFFRYNSGGLSRLHCKSGQGKITCNSCE